jgi:hypothetical protein
VGETELSWCDTQGSRRFDLHKGEAAASPHACPEKTEPNGACGGLPIEVTVMTPGLGPVDVVWVGDWTFHPLGRVHDCALDGSTLAIVTGGSVELLDVRTGKTQVIDENAGGNRVAIGHRWLAWADGVSLIRVVRF